MTGGMNYTQSIYAMISRPAYYYDTLASTLTSSKTANIHQLADLINKKKTSSVQIYLCPQHLPKFHPAFDVILKGILEGVDDSIVVILSAEKKHQWRRTLEQRWLTTIGITYMPLF
jgi:hypothetical protein